MIGLSRLLSGVAPVALLLIGAVPAFVAGWGAREAKFQWLDRPAIVREATAAADSACAIRTMDAARRAEQAERARQLAANAEARRIYDEALSASDRARRVAETKLEQEISDYEHQIMAEGRSCVLTDADIDWLYQHRAPSSD